MIRSMRQQEPSVAAKPLLLITMLVAHKSRIGGGPAATRRADAGMVVGSSAAGLGRGANMSGGSRARDEAIGGGARGELGEAQDPLPGSPKETKVASREIFAGS